MLPALPAFSRIRVCWVYRNVVWPIAGLGPARPITFGAKTQWPDKIYQFGKGSPHLPFFEAALARSAEPVAPAFPAEKKIRGTRIFGQSRRGPASTSCRVVFGL